VSKKTLVGCLLILSAALVIIWISRSEVKKENIFPETIQSSTKNNGQSPNLIAEKLPQAEIVPEKIFLPPLSRASERVTRKSFGLFVTPKNSPVQPEKFSGYHTGTDFEIFPDEENADVPVKAVCNGKLLTKKPATGYGGVAVESCELNGEPITVVYGHLKLTSINFKVGDKINVGDTFSTLGRGYSSETSGERKHLHLGFRKGAAVNILGYVQNKSELARWLDPCQFVCTDCFRNIHIAPVI